MEDHVDGEYGVSAEKLADIYVKIRDARTALKERFESEDDVLKEQLELVAAKMLDLCQDIDADSIRTPAGTIIRKVDTRYWTTDWESMYDFIHENDCYGLLEKRLHQTNMKQFLEEHPEKLPAGLQADSKYSIVVRRSKS
jgi:hypothetical protein